MSCADRIAGCAAVGEDCASNLPSDSTMAQQCVCLREIVECLQRVANDGCTLALDAKKVIEDAAHCNYSPSAYNEHDKGLHWWAILLIIMLLSGFCSAFWFYFYTQHWQKQRRDVEKI
eukprot:TRINITY_DN3758_c0_g1_i1.p1 TRINITY_DN3758_c0_g1~~TRINITY_DN3758_c0_g1_i1.p1  ORF type:complete len:118 (+),score=4.92 TRINITY_DN3758_c0_g1_i1:42-395(+)